MEELYTIKEVCSILKTTRATIDRWRKENKIQVININGSVRIKKSELERLLKGGSK